MPWPLSLGMKYRQHIIHNADIHERNSFTLVINIKSASPLRAELKLNGIHKILNFKP